MKVDESRKRTNIDHYKSILENTDSCSNDQSDYEKKSIFKQRNP